MMYKNEKDCDLTSHIEDTHGNQIASEMLNCPTWFPQPQKTTSMSHSTKFLHFWLICDKGIHLQTDRFLPEDMDNTNGISINKLTHFGLSPSQASTSRSKCILYCIVKYSGTVFLQQGPEPRMMLRCSLSEGILENTKIYIGRRNLRWDQ